MAKSIGEALKEVRLQAGLTQKEMCDGVCSVSAYSKIEHGIHKIDLDTLCEILDNNRGLINSDYFLSSILSENNKQAESKVLKSISTALIVRDVEKFNEIKEKVIKENTLTDLIKEYLDYGENILTESEEGKTYPKIRERVQILERIEEWNGVAIEELRLILPFVSIKESSNFIKKIYRRLKKSPDNNFEKSFTINFLALLVDYLYVLLNENAAEELFIFSFNIIHEITNSFYLQEFFGYGLIARKIEAIVNREENIYHDIVKIQKFIGMLPSNESEILEDNKFFKQRHNK